MTTLALPVSLAGDPVFFLFMQRVAGPGWVAARVAVRARQRGMGHTARFLAPGVRMTRIPFLPWLAAAVLLASGHAQAASPTSLKHTTFDFDPAVFELVDESRNELGAGAVVVAVDGVAQFSLWEFPRADGLDEVDMIREMDDEETLATPPYPLSEGPAGWSCHFVDFKRAGALPASVMTCAGRKGRDVAVLTVMTNAERTSPELYAAIRTMIASVRFVAAP